MGRGEKEEKEKRKMKKGKGREEEKRLLKATYKRNYSVGLKHFAFRLTRIHLSLRRIEGKWKTLGKKRGGEK